MYVCDDMKLSREVLLDIRKNPSPKSWLGPEQAPQGMVIALKIPKIFPLLLLIKLLFMARGNLMRQV